MTADGQKSALNEPVSRGQLNWAPAGDGGGATEPNVASGGLRVGHT